MPNFLAFLFFAGVSLVSAAAALLLTGRWADARRRPRPGGALVFADAPRRYEFREGYLVSPLDPNDAFLPAGTDRSAAFDTLARALRPVNPDLPARLSALARRGATFVLPGRFGPDALTVAGRTEEDRIVITIGPAEAGTGREIVDGAALAALRTEAEDLRAALDAAPAAMWKQGADGRILWANAPYFALVERGLDAAGAAVAWPVPALFDTALSPLPEPGLHRRVALPGPPDADGGPWFEVAAHRQADAALLCSAQPIDRLVEAETALESFVQTLSKTFAQLPIGLAVFDRRRELILFNPALVTLTTLSPGFLTGRPALTGFLDALRDRQRMPEPRNYRHWRDEIARLETASAAGTYQELWTLPSGESLRVVGRPHPDGALALMFEDITPEMTLTRRVRAEIDLLRAALDAQPGALALVSGEGRLVHANPACAALWGLDPPAPGAPPPSLAETLARWAARSQPSRFWDDLARLGTRPGARTGLSGTVTLSGGRRVAVQVLPLPGGALSVAFAPDAAELADPDPADAPRPAAPALAEPPVPFRPRPRAEA